ncbi:U11/U12 small nuclear ribonucleoprotein 35 kDa protein-like [Pararge aegeria]|uniref:U11/U12 small nuclear ribonucleoprotein 35 kDa protein n=2 Tax=Pararge aegeria TaxID=116150 RepID=A0A8S4SBQ7_9NEOP|nr:U11/U12 small nuclear ribonucleoprotein 35 kDa protein-like [Pararge aegeria]XP_039745241.1 U11/U12 small nuclear ribonucleoprotein 35 kDa protein-like [Pararge aegeria]CAH2254018.1 jg9951 [Pararge aegeria aegeria]
MYREDNEFQKYATTTYEPIKIGSIDGTDTEPHDRSILRAVYSEYIPNKQVKGDPHHTVFVARLNPRTTQNTIHSEFSKFGRIINCRLVKDIVTGKSKQYAFVEYESLSSVDRALREMHQKYIEGAEVIVEKEAERRLQGWKPRRLGGGFGGKKESGQLRFGCRDRPFRKPLLVTSKSDRTK